MIRAFTVAASVPWAITEAALETVLSIAAREHLDPHAVAAQLGHKLDNAHAVTTRDGVAIIPVSGPIFRYADMFTQVSGATSVETLGTDLATALADPQVESILLEIDSPGGAVNGIHEFAQAVYDARDRKPITAYVGHQAASAAYWIASAASTIVMDPTAAVGSIGVIAAVPDPHKQSAKELTFVSSQSPNKRPDPTTERGKAQLQSLVDYLADIFISAVARNRGTDAEAVQRDFGAGGVLIGQVAVDAGMTDRVGSFEATIAALQQDARERRRGHPRTQGVAAMDFKAFWSDLFSAAREAAPDDRSLAETTPTKEHAVRAVSGPMVDPEKDALKQELDRLRAERSQEAARAFAREQITAGRALPAQTEALTTLYIALAADDARAGDTSRVTALTGMFATAPAHALTMEAVAPGVPIAIVENLQVTERTGVEKPMDDAERTRLYAMTATGQAILAAERAVKTRP